MQSDLRAIFLRDNVNKTKRRETLKENHESSPGPYYAEADPLLLEATIIFKEIEGVQDKAPSIPCMLIVDLCVRVGVK